MCSGLETALSCMTKGERSIIVVDALEMRAQPSEDGRQRSQTSLVPEPPAKASQVELEIELLGLVQVGKACGESLKREKVIPFSIPLPV